jgi:hypothetical protein
LLVLHHNISFSNCIQAILIVLFNLKNSIMKNSINLGKTLTRSEMKNVSGGTSIPALPGYKCGSEICSHYQACCTRESASGQTVYYCTTTACL